jgi:hypothetical protein
MPWRGFRTSLKTVSDTSVRPAYTIDASATRGKPLIYQHSSMVRLTHWVGVACAAILLMSGLQMFNAHPALYLGQASSFEHPIVSIGTAEKNGHEIGVTDILGHRNTTGVLGLSVGCESPPNPSRCILLSTLCRSFCWRLALALRLNAAVSADY